jgi:hypothetical protein
VEAELYHQFLFFREAHLQQTTIIDGLFAKTDPKTMKMYAESMLENVMQKTSTTIRKVTPK